MNESTLESLIQDLARGDVSTFPLTEEQEILSIPLPLVYLAGLVLSHDETFGRRNSSTHIIPDSQSLHQQLKTYCQLYNNYLIAAASTKPLLQVVTVMSPRIRPTNEQLLVIQNDISNKAQALLQELLQLQNEHTGKENHITHSHQTYCKKTKAKKKKKNRKANIGNCACTCTCTKQEEQVHLHTSSDHGPSKESLDQVVRMHLNTTLTSENNSEDWIAVPKLTRMATTDLNPPANKDTMQVEQPISQGDLPSLSLLSENFPSDTSSATSEDSCSPLTGLATRTSSSMIFDSTPHRNTRELWNEHKNEQNDERQPQTQPQPTATTDTDSSLLGTTNNRIRELELALAQANHVLFEERQRHRQELKEEKERHVNSMQALQLRLYISETRLKTYQDALDDHIHSVAENVYHPTGSPTRRSCQENNRNPSHPPASPLISRVLQQTNRLSVDDNNY